MNTERTTSFLMANLGSELTRFFVLQRQGDHKNAEARANRSLDIISKIMVREDIGNGKKEIGILKDIVEDVLSGSRKYNVTGEELSSYFFPFAQRVLTV